MPRPPSRDIPVVRGDRLSVTVDGFGDGPDGIARIGDYIVFVPGVLPGERAYVEITSAARKYGRASLLEIEQPAADRVEPRCAHFLTCGGCHRQHQAYAAQLHSKQARLQRTVSFALGDGAPDVAPTVAAASPYGERHKVAAQLLQAPNGRLTAALHRARSPELVAIHECPASDALAWDLVERTVELLNRLPHGAWDPWFAPKALLRSVLVRTTTDGYAHLVLVAIEPRIPGLEDLLDELRAAGASSVSVNHNDGDPARLLGPHTELLDGRPFVFEHLAGCTYRIAPTTFFQTSPRMAEQLIEHVVEWLAPTPADDVGDLYCGGGLLTLPLARRARSAFGIERNGFAIDDARASASESRIQNATFRAGDSLGWLRACGRELPKPHLVAMDPPRTGLEAGIVQELQRLRPARLAYVSCEPQSLQRDLRDLQAAGFRCAAVVPFDMFPQTCHVESVAMLEPAR